MEYYNELWKKQTLSPAYQFFYIVAFMILYFVRFMIMRQNQLYRKQPLMGPFINSLKFQNPKNQYSSC